MGKKIDRFVLTVALAGILYLFFLRLWGNKYSAIIAALITCAALRRISKSILARLGNCSFIRKHRIRMQANGILMKIACMQEDAAHAFISELIEKSYHDDSPVELIQEPPSCMLDTHSLFSAWKKHRDTDKLIICCTCKTDQNLHILAASLRNPQVALVSGDTIAHIAASQGFVPDENKHIRLKTRQFFARISVLIFNRRNAPRCLLISAVLLILYLLGGKISYLASSMLLLFTAFVSLHRRRLPEKLF